MTPKLNRHTVAPIGSRIHNENTRQVAVVAPEAYRIGEGSAKAPRSNCGGAVGMIRQIMTGLVICVADSCIRT